VAIHHNKLHWNTCLYTIFMGRENIWWQFRLQGGDTRCDRQMLHSPVTVDEAWQPSGRSHECVLSITLHYCVV